MPIVDMNRKKSTIFVKIFERMFYYCFFYAYLNVVKLV
jgi:hypothetical protein